MEAAQKVIRAVPNFILDESNFEYGSNLWNVGYQ